MSAQKGTVERWRLTDDHLCLSVGILPDEASNRRWKPIQQFWIDASQRLVHSPVQKGNSCFISWQRE